MADTMLQHCEVVVNLCVLTIEIERMLFSEVRILGNAAFTPTMTTNMVSVASVAACDARITSAIPQKGLFSFFHCGLERYINYASLEYDIVWLVHLLSKQLTLQMSDHKPF